jgi:uncharacterized protein (DUF4415 family)
MRTCGDRPSASVEARQDIKRKPPSAPRDEVVGCKQVCPAAQWPSLLRRAGARAEVTELDLLPVGAIMRKQYDFSSSRKNPYASQLKKSVTIRLDEDSITYFKAMSEQTGIPYQSLINLYLKECASSGRKLNLAWK